MCVCVRLSTGYFFLRCSCMTKVVIFSTEIVIPVKRNCRTGQEISLNVAFIYEGKYVATVTRIMVMICHFLNKKKGKKVLGSVHTTPEKFLFYRL